MGSRTRYQIGERSLEFNLGFYLLPMCSHCVLIKFLRFTETGDEMRSQDQKQTQAQKKTHTRGGGSN